MAKKGGKDTELRFSNMLFGLMWKSLESEREVDAKVTVRLTVYVAMASTLLGAGLGGLFTYWYSHETPNLAVVGVWFTLVVVTLVLTVYLVPKSIDSFRENLDFKSWYDVFKDSYESGLLDKWLDMDPSVPRPPFPPEDLMMRELAVLSGKISEPPHSKGT